MYTSYEDTELTKMNLQNYNFKKSIISGFVACGYIIPLCVCFASAMGQGLWIVLSACMVCALFSIEKKDSILIPDIRLIAILLSIYSSVSYVGLYISLVIGGICFLLFKKSNHTQNSSPHHLISLNLGLAITATIFLTNIYFGIGAPTASSAISMLKAYGYLGFHPNFMGLLTGTITLFTMITYPFKFKKLSKKIPPYFITLAIPFVLNLFLNPDKSLTTVNEASFLTFSSLSMPDFDLLQILVILLYGAILGLIIYYFNYNESTAFGISHILSPFPLRRITLKDYNIVSAVIVIAVTVITAYLCPFIYTRLPLHCVGALLIVYAWQSIPYGKFKEAFSGKKKILIIFVLIILFLVIDTSYAALWCLPDSTSKEEDNK